MTIKPTGIKIMLAERGLTQAELAAKAGISPQSISAILQRGTCEPRTAGKLAAALGIPVADIIAKKGD